MLKDSRLHIVVTGAGGWIGQAIIEMLESALGRDVHDRLHVFGSSRRRMLLRSGASIECHALAGLPDLRAGSYLLAHLAFVTREHVSIVDHRDYVAANEAISAMMFDYAQRSAPVGLFLPSSGAVYGQNGELDADVRSNPYGALKLRDERRFRTLPIPEERMAVMRIFNLAGPFLNKAEHYALGSILMDLRAGGPIRLRADHPVIRSYVHVRDVAEIAFALMLGLVPGSTAPFDTAGETAVEVGQLADVCATVLGHPNVRIERPAMRVDVPSDRYVGDGTTMASVAAGLGLALAPLPKQIVDTAAFLWEGGA